MEGLVEFYSCLIARAVPSDGRVLLYNNPVLTATETKIDLVRLLVDKYPNQVVGIKDSSSNLDYALALCKSFPDISVFVGDDRLVLETLKAGAAGAITGISGVYPELLVELLNLTSDETRALGMQERVNATHQKFDGLPRIAAFKELLVAGKVLRNSAVRPPLRGLTEGELTELKSRFNYGQSLAQIGFGALSTNTE
jgi:4-hydroxy-tetrahydrodipicolinate synthase